MKRSESLREFPPPVKLFRALLRYRDSLPSDVQAWLVVLAEKPVVTNYEMRRIQELHREHVPRTHIALPTPPKTKRAPEPMSKRRTWQAPPPCLPKLVALRERLPEHRQEWIDEMSTRQLVNGKEYKKIVGLFGAVVTGRLKARA